MKAKDRKLLVSATLGELDPEKMARLDGRLAAEPELQAAFERMAGVHALVLENPRAGFRPGFVGRALARLAAETRHSLSAALALRFRRLAPAALAVIVGLLAYNLFTGGSESRSAVEVALGLQPVTLEVAYDQDSGLAP